MFRQKTFFYSYIDDSDIEGTKTPHDSIEDAFKAAIDNQRGGVYVISMNLNANRSDWKKWYPIREFDHFEIDEFREFVKNQTPENAFF